MSPLKFNVVNKLKLFENEFLKSKSAIITS